MKQRRWLLLILTVFLLNSLLLNACTFSVQVLNTPTVLPPVVASLVPTAAQTPVPPTVALASATPTLISIRAETIPMLEIFHTFRFADIVRSVAFTPDGTVVAAAGGNTQDFAIHLWDVVNGQSLGTLDGHTNIIWSVAFSPDGRLLASSSADKTVKVWDWRAKTLLKSLDFPGQVVNVRFSPDGQSLAAGGVDELQNQIQNAAIWMFSVNSWEPLRKFPEYLNIGAMAFSPKGGTLIGGGTSRNIQVWRTDNSTPVFTLSHAHQVSSAAISPDGTTVATATCETATNAECMAGGIWLWDLPTGKLIKTLTGFTDTVENVAFSADGSTLIAATRDGTLRFYGTSEYRALFEFASPGGISALALSPDGGLLATGNINGEVYLWKNVYHP